MPVKMRYLTAKTLANTALVLSVCALMELANATNTANAEGLDCTKARAVERRGEEPPSAAQALLREVSEIYGLGLLSEWTRNRLTTVEVPSGKADAGWKGDWITHPLDAETGLPVTDVLGGLQIKQHFGQPWLVWHVDASEPCEGRSYVPVSIKNSTILTLETEVLYQSIVERMSFGGPRYAPVDSQALAQMWDQARPVLASVTITRRGDTCTLAYQIPDGPVALSFFCTPQSGG